MENFYSMECINIEKILYLLPDGFQVLAHYAHDHTEMVSGNGIPSYYIMKYSNDYDYTIHYKSVLLTARETNNRVHLQPVHNIIK
jgi:hypothetical protein